MDRNDKVFTLLYKIVMHKKVSHPDEIQNTNHIPSFEGTYQSTTNRYLYSRTNFDRIYGTLLISFLWQFLTLLPRIICNKVLRVFQNTQPAAQFKHRSTSSRGAAPAKARTSASP